MASPLRFFLLVLAGLVGCSPYQRPASRNRPANHSELAGTAPEPLEKALLQAVNAVRAREKIPELRWHSSAAVAAESHSRAMAERGFFSHGDPKRGDLAGRLQQAGVRWRAIAENLFQQRGCPDAVQCAVEGWLGSSGHRRNLLNPAYTHTGIGVSSDQRGTVYYTQIFLKP